MASLTLLLCQWVSLSVILALSQAIEWPVHKDSGIPFILMYRKDYDQKIRALLDDTSYQAIKRNPKMKIERKVTEVLRSLEKKANSPLI